MYPGVKGSLLRKVMGRVIVHNRSPRSKFTIVPRLALNTNYLILKKMDSFLFCIQFHWYVRERNKLESYMSKTTKIQIIES